MHAMSLARRNKLRLLQEREAAKSRMSRLKTMLQHKLILKYGSKRNVNSTLNKEIEAKVSAFTARTSRQPTDEEFLELENAVRELRTMYVKSGGAGVDPTDSRDSGRKGDTRGSEASEGNGCTGGNSKTEDHKKIVGDGVGDVDGGGESGLPPSIARAWATFDLAKQLEHEKKERQKAAKAFQQKIMFRKELEAHRAKQAEKKAAEEKERRRHVEEQEKRLADFRMEQDAIKKRGSDKHAEEKALREQQIKRLQAEKEMERQARLAKEIHDIEQCKTQLQGELDDAERKRRREKDRLAAIQAENAKQREIRAQRQRESDEADARLLKEHRRRIDEEEQARAAKLKQRMKRFEDIGNFWSERRACTEENIEQREAQQVLTAARRKEEATLERERREREARSHAAIVMAAENAKVIQEKNALSAKKHKEDREFAQRFINDSEKFRQEERDKISKKRMAMAKYRKDLEIQVQETKARRAHEDMNDTEYRMNSDIVKKLEADKELVAQVRKRMESAH